MTEPTEEVIDQIIEARKAGRVKGAAYRRPRYVAYAHDRRGDLVPIFTIGSREDLALHWIEIYPDDVVMVEA